MTNNNLSRVWDGCCTDDKKIRKILIANRGEIACRIIYTCRKLKIKSVAIYEQSDENTKHTNIADQSIELPSGTSYTSIETIVRICREFEVDAVHPGYGFLSENPKFCRALQEAGITFLGPYPNAIEAFGLKHIARELAAKSGVPIVPGTAILPNIENAVKEAKRLTYPVMLKATAGGGGIGMQNCNDEQDLKSAFKSCQTLADQYFGNSSVYLEKYYPHSRHIEVQIFGNGLGDVVHFGERECSVQRRNQKLIEETPSPFLSVHPGLRNQMCAAAVKLASEINYQSAGTVEFLVVDEGDSSQNTGMFYFLEMNTRLQVEHGVTELTNGVDLVEWMILQGNAQRSDNGGLDLSSFHWNPSGHAIEVRIYAENPVRNFQPSPGLLTKVQWPDDEAVRVDTWVDTGTVVGSHYDPLIAKVIVLGKDRVSATDKMAEALKKSVVAGPATNIAYLESVLTGMDFLSGKTTTQILNKVQFQPNAIEVLQGGMETTVQDLPGRMALRVYGVNKSGPMDDLAFKVANLLVGNRVGTAGLEITMKGPQLLFHTECTIALTGAAMQISFKTSKEASAILIPMWSRLNIPAGGILSIGVVPKGKAGCRCYMAIAGGLDIPDFLGSKSTFAAFSFGGFQGRSFQSGDMIPLPLNRKTSCQVQFSVTMTLPETIVPSYKHNWIIRVLTGPHANPHFITNEGMDELFATEYKVHYNSNRMGVRLVGPKPKWARPDGGQGGSHPSNIHDYGYALGSINFTGDSPVILTGDGPTQGGFVCPWTVISCEMWKVGQVSAGDTIRFCPISCEETKDLRVEHKEYLEYIETWCGHQYQIPDTTRSFEQVLSMENISSVKIISSNGVLFELAPDPKSQRPLVQYRQAGDCCVVVEYGIPADALDFNLLARVKVLQDTLRLHTDTDSRKVKNALIQGTLDAIPCVRTLLIRYDPDILLQVTLVKELVILEDQIPDCSKIAIPSREIHLPLAFDDRWCREATEKYMSIVRKEAVYLPSNVDFIAENNGLAGGKQEVCEKVTGSPWLVVGIGFYLGCPMMAATNPLHRLNVPKYNPARTYTASGTVGLAGSFSCIYPLESPGGYQMCGRTVPTWDTFGSVEPFRSSQPWLLQMFDQVIFDLVSEEELLTCRKLSLAGKFPYKFKETTFDMAKQNDLVASLKDEIATMQKQKEEANKRMLAIETEYLKQTIPYLSNQTIKQETEELSDNQFAVEAGMTGCVKTVSIKVGDTVVANDTILCTLVAMKTEMSVTSHEHGKIFRVDMLENQQVGAETVICIVDRVPLI